MEASRRQVHAHIANGIPSVVDIKPGPGLEAGFEIEQRGLYERAGQKLGEASVT